MAVSNKGFTTTDGIDLNEVLYGTVLPIIELYNTEEELDMRGLITVDGDESYFKFNAAGKWKFQILGEAEKPTSKKKVYGKRQKDTLKYGLDIDYTYDWLLSEMASSTEIANMAALAVERDRALQTSVIMDVCVQSTTDGWYNGSFSSDEKMDRPPTYGTSTFATSHSHYVASGATTLSLSDITAAKKHLKEHGYNGRIFGFCNADFYNKIEDLAGFYWSTTATYAIPTPIQASVSVDGFQGRLLGVDWINTEWFVDDYFMLIGTTAGQSNPVRFIQKKKDMAKGLLLMNGAFDPTYPIINATYLHYLAAQVLHRGAGVVYYLNTVWADPTAITTNVVE